MRTPRKVDVFARALRQLVGQEARQQDERVERPPAQIGGATPCGGQAAIAWREEVRRDRQREHGAFDDARCPACPRTSALREPNAPGGSVADVERVRASLISRLPPPALRSAAAACGARTATAACRLRAALFGQNQPTIVTNTGSAP